MRKRFTFYLILSIIIGPSFISCNEENNHIAFDSIVNAQKKEAKQRKGRNHANIEYSTGEIKSGPSTDGLEYDIYVYIKDNQLVIEVKEKLEDSRIIIKDKDGFIVYKENNITIEEKKVITIDSANNFPYYLIITATGKEIKGKIISYWVYEDDEE